MHRKSIPVLLFCLLTPALAQAQVAVQVSRLADVLVDLDRRAPADVRPLNEAHIAAEVSAVVSAVHADVGQLVARGDLLLAFDATDYRLAVEQAEANLASSQARKAQADARLRRAEELGENQFLSADELLERQTDVIVLAAQIDATDVALAIARRNLQKCSVRAPFAGVVMERFAQVGSFVTNGVELLRLSQVDAFELDAEIPADIADSLTGADAMHFESQGERWPVELLRLSPVIETERRTRRARLSFPADHPVVGRSGELVWNLDRGQLPSHLISRRNGELGVFVHESGQAVFMLLPEAQEGRPAPVSLSLDAEIIVLGRDRLQDGDAVTVRR